MAQTNIKSTALEQAVSLREMVLRHGYLKWLHAMAYCGYVCYL